MSNIYANNINPRSGTTVTFPQNIKVLGTATYEDVANVDSVGIITARSGIVINTQSTSVNPLSVGSKGGGTNDGHLEGEGPKISFLATRSGDGAVGGAAYIQQKAIGDLSSSYPVDLAFGVRRFGSSFEAMRILSTGSIGIGTDTPTSFGPTLQVAGTDPALLLQDTATAVDYFGVNVTSGITQLWYDDAAALTINTASGISGSGLVERLRLNSDGKLILSGTARTTPFISGDGGMCIEQNYAGNLRALSIRNKNTDAAAATSMCFSLNRSGGDQDFTAGEIKLEKEQAWSTSSATVDGAMTFSTISNGTMAEKLRITAAGNLIQKSIYSTYTNNSGLPASSTRTLTITGLQYGTATIHFGGSDGNAQYVHFKINLGGMMWASGSGYNAEVSSTGYSGGSYSVTKNNTSYVIQVNSGTNPLYYSYTFESTSYTPGNYATIAES